MNADKEIPFRGGTVHRLFLPKPAEKYVMVIDCPIIFPSDKTRKMSLYRHFPCSHWWRIPSKHCCETSSAPVSILVTSEWDGNNLSIQVLDNGPGIPEETLLKITESLTREETQDALTSSIGLINVHRRLRLHFGASSGLYIVSGAEGTTITLTIPQNISREEGIICTEH